MAIAFLVGRDEKGQKGFDWFSQSFNQALLALDPNLDIRSWPDVGNLEDITCAIVWQHPLGVLKKFPNLKCIIAASAGVDHVFVDPDLPKNVPIVRVIDPFMANDIVQYVVVSVLNYVKRITYYLKHQSERMWLKKPPFTFSDKTIGIMGLGFLGEKTAKMLRSLNLNVIGWSNSRKNIDGVKSFVGPDEFDDFLSQTGILICMLPLTAKTENILNKKTFSKLQKEAYLINLARGQHLVEEDLLAALGTGQLSGACLDVFREEPLPSDHPFWMHPKIQITPHIASVTNPETAAPQILDNYHRALKGAELLNVVDVSKGY
ncbi:2-hydroxyacid dehydrogenase [Candidiatus Paracoxiella cheracis]|uniref:2-hydroxyacid dehydrogenase n=1 Tax=Candidiatus Paracoxiella cheracis TaxID=3405120 RepID=UPI003BF5352B